MVSPADPHRGGRGKRRRKIKGERTGIEREEKVTGVFLPLSQIDRQKGR